ncbi:MAG: hypothetical protein CVU67_04695, partial [Deltaproteobacteria bacterium HGW-Deltaproteobacteria-24]
MFEMLLNKAKATEENFFKELLNQNMNLEKLNKIYKELKLDLNSLYFQDEFILHYCCKKDLFQAVLWLISNGINIEFENSQKETAIFYAIHAKSSAILQTLIDNKITFYKEKEKLENGYLLRNQELVKSDVEMVYNYILKQQI